jgi:hypothetical protein
MNEDNKSPSWKDALGPSSVQMNPYTRYDNADKDESPAAREQAQADEAYRLLERERKIKELAIAGKLSSLGPGYDLLPGDGDTWNLGVQSRAVATWNANNYQTSSGALGVNYTGDSMRVKNIEAWFTDQRSDSAWDYDHSIRARDQFDSIKDKFEHYSEWNLPAQAENVVGRVMGTMDTPWVPGSVDGLGGYPLTGNKFIDTNLSAFSTFVQKTVGSLPLVSPYYTASLQETARAIPSEYKFNPEGMWSAMQAGDGIMFSEKATAVFNELKKHGYTGEFFSGARNEIDMIMQMDNEYTMIQYQKAMDYDSKNRGMISNGLVTAKEFLRDSIFNSPDVGANLAIDIALTAASGGLWAAGRVTAGLAARAAARMSATGVASKLAATAARAAAGEVVEATVVRGSTTAYGLTKLSDGLTTAARVMAKTRNVLPARWMHTATHGFEVVSHAAVKNPAVVRLVDSLIRNGVTAAQGRKILGTLMGDALSGFMEGAVESFADQKKKIREGNQNDISIKSLWDNMLAEAVVGTMVFGPIRSISGILNNGLRDAWKTHTIKELHSADSVRILLDMNPDMKPNEAHEVIAALVKSGMTMTQVRDSLLKKAGIDPRLTTPHSRVPVTVLNDPNIMARIHKDMADHGASPETIATVGNPAAAPTATLTRLATEDILKVRDDTSTLEEKADIAKLKKEIEDHKASETMDLPEITKDPTYVESRMKRLKEIYAGIDARAAGSFEGFTPQESDALTKLDAEHKALIDELKAISDTADTAKLSEASQALDAVIAADPENKNPSAANTRRAIQQEIGFQKRSALQKSQRAKEISKRLRQIKGEVNVILKNNNIVSVDRLRRMTQGLQFRNLWNAYSVRQNSEAAYANVTKAQRNVTTVLADNPELFQGEGIGDLADNLSVVVKSTFGYSPEEVVGMGILSDSNGFVTVAGIKRFMGSHSDDSYLEITGKVNTDYVKQSIYQNREDLALLLAKLVDDGIKQVYVNNPFQGKNKLVNVEDLVKNTPDTPTVLYDENGVILGYDLNESDFAIFAYGSMLKDHSSSKAFFAHETKDLSVEDRIRGAVKAMERRYLNRSIGADDYTSFDARVLKVAERAHDWSTEFVPHLLKDASGTYNVSDDTKAKDVTHQELTKSLVSAWKKLQAIKAEIYARPSETRRSDLSLAEVVNLFPKEIQDLGIRWDQVWTESLSKTPGQVEGMPMFNIAALEQQMLAMMDHQLAKGFAYDQVGNIGHAMRALIDSRKMIENFNTGFLEFGKKKFAEEGGQYRLQYLPAEHITADSQRFLMGTAEEYEAEAKAAFERRAVKRNVKMTWEDASYALLANTAFSFNSLGNGEFDFINARQAGEGLADLMAGIDEGTRFVTERTFNTDQSEEQAQEEWQKAYGTESVYLREVREQGTYAPADTQKVVQAYGDFVVRRRMNNVLTQVAKMDPEERKIWAKVILGRITSRDPVDVNDKAIVKDVYGFALAPTPVQWNPNSDVPTLDDMKRLISEMLFDTPKVMSLFTHDAVVIPFGTRSGFLNPSYKSKAATPEAQALENFTRMMPRVGLAGGFNTQGIVPLTPAWALVQGWELMHRDLTRLTELSYMTMLAANAQEQDDSLFDMNTYHDASFRGIQDINAILYRQKTGVRQIFAKLVSELAGKDINEIIPKLLEAKVYTEAGEQDLYSVVANGIRDQLNKLHKSAHNDPAMAKVLSNLKLLELTGDKAWRSFMKPTVVQTAYMAGYDLGVKTIGNGIQERLEELNSRVKADGTKETPITMTPEDISAVSNVIAQLALGQSDNLDNSLLTVFTKNNSGNDKINQAIIYNTLFPGGTKMHEVRSRILAELQQGILSFEADELKMAFKNMLASMPQIDQLEVINTIQDAKIRTAIAAQSSNESGPKRDLANLRTGKLDETPLGKLYMERAKYANAMMDELAKQDPDIRVNGLPQEWAKTIEDIYQGKYDHKLSEERRKDLEARGVIDAKGNLKSYYYTPLNVRALSAMNSTPVSINEDNIPLQSRFTPGLETSDYSPWLNVPVFFAHSQDVTAGRVQPSIWEPGHPYMAAFGKISGTSEDPTKANVGIWKLVDLLESDAAVLTALQATMDAARFENYNEILGGTNPLMGIASETPDDLKEDFFSEWDRREAKTIDDTKYSDEHRSEMLAELDDDTQGYVNKSVNPYAVGDIFTQQTSLDPTAPKTSQLKTKADWDALGDRQAPKPDAGIAMHRPLIANPRMTFRNLGSMAMRLHKMNERLAVFNKAKDTLNRIQAINGSDVAVPKGSTGFTYGWDTTSMPEVTEWNGLHVGDDSVTQRALVLRRTINDFRQKYMLEKDLPDWQVYEMHKFSKLTGSLIKKLNKLKKQLSPEDYELAKHHVLSKYRHRLETLNRYQHEAQGFQWNLMNGMPSGEVMPDSSFSKAIGKTWRDAFAGLTTVNNNMVAVALTSPIQTGNIIPLTDDMDFSNVGIESFDTKGSKAARAVLPTTIHGIEMMGMIANYVFGMQQVEEFVQSQPRLRAIKAASTGDWRFEVGMAMTPKEFAELSEFTKNNHSESTGFEIVIPTKAGVGLKSKTAGATEISAGDTSMTNSINSNTMGYSGNTVYNGRMNNTQVRVPLSQGMAIKFMLGVANQTAIRQVMMANTLKLDRLNLNRTMEHQARLARTVSSDVLDADPDLIDTDVALNIDNLRRESTLDALALSMLDPTLSTSIHGFLGTRIAADPSVQHVTYLNTSWPTAKNDPNWWWRGVLANIGRGRLRALSVIANYDPNSALGSTIEESSRIVKIISDDDAAVVGWRTLTGDNSEFTNFNVVKGMMDTQSKITEAYFNDASDKSKANAGITALKKGQGLYVLDVYLKNARENSDAFLAPFIEAVQSELNELKYSMEHQDPPIVLDPTAHAAAMSILANHWAPEEFLASLDKTTPSPVVVTVDDGGGVGNNSSSTEKFLNNTEQLIKRLTGMFPGIKPRDIKVRLIAGKTNSHSFVNGVHEITLDPKKQDNSMYVYTVMHEFGHALHTELANNISHKAYQTLVNYARQLMLQAHQVSMQMDDPVAEWISAKNPRLLSDNEVMATVFGIAASMRNSDPQVDNRFKQFAAELLKSGRGEQGIIEFSAASGNPSLQSSNQINPLEGPEVAAILKGAVDTQTLLNMTVAEVDALVKERAQPNPASGSTATMAWNRHRDPMVRAAVVILALNKVVADRGGRIRANSEIVRMVRQHLIDNLDESFGFSAVESQSTYNGTWVAQTLSSLISPDIISTTGLHSGQGFKFDFMREISSAEARIATFLADRIDYLDVAKSLQVDPALADKLIMMNMATTGSNTLDPALIAKIFPAGLHKVLQAKMEKFMKGFLTNQEAAIEALRIHEKIRSTKEETWERSPVLLARSLRTGLLRIESSPKWLTDGIARKMRDLGKGNLHKISAPMAYIAGELPSISSAKDAVLWINTNLEKKANGKPYSQMVNAFEELLKGYITEVNQGTKLVKVLSSSVKDDDVLRATKHLFDSVESGLVGNSVITDPALPGVVIDFKQNHANYFNVLDQATIGTSVNPSKLHELLAWARTGGWDGFGKNRYSLKDGPKNILDVHAMQLMNLMSARSSVLASAADAFTPYRNDLDLAEMNNPGTHNINVVDHKGQTEEHPFFSMDLEDQIQGLKLPYIDIAQMEGIREAYGVSGLRIQDMLTTLTNDLNIDDARLGNVNRVIQEEAKILQQALNLAMGLPLDKTLMNESNMTDVALFVRPMATIMWGNNQAVGQLASESVMQMLMSLTEGNFFTGLISTFKGLVETLKSPTNLNPLSMNIVPGDVTRRTAAYMRAHALHGLDLSTFTNDVVGPVSKVLNLWARLRLKPALTIQEFQRNTNAFAARYAMHEVFSSNRIQNFIADTSVPKSRIELEAKLRKAGFGPLDTAVGLSMARAGLLNKEFLEGWKLITAAHTGSWDVGDIQEEILGIKDTAKQALATRAMERYLYWETNRLREFVFDREGALGPKPVGGFKLLFSIYRGYPMMAFSGRYIRDQHLKTRTQYYTQISFLVIQEIIYSLLKLTPLALTDPDKFETRIKAWMSDPKREALLAMSRGPMFGIIGGWASQSALSLSGVAGPVSGVGDIIPFSAAKQGIKTIADTGADVYNYTRGEPNSLAKSLMKSAGLLPIVGEPIGLGGVMHGIALFNRDLLTEAYKATKHPNPENDLLGSLISGMGGKVEKMKTFNKTKSPPRKPMNPSNPKQRNIRTLVPKDVTDEIKKSIVQSVPKELFGNQG